MLGWIQYVLLAGAKNEQKCEVIYFLVKSKLIFLRHKIRDLMKYMTLLLLMMGSAVILTAQSASISGTIQSEGEAVAFANVRIAGTDKGTLSEMDGSFRLEGVALGNYTLEIFLLGYETQQLAVALTSDQPELDLTIELPASKILLDQVVVTGTRTFKRQTQSPVIVNVTDSKALDNVQACTLSDGLRFQPGLRVETDCQTCNYTQLRMNGLAGGYSQILINGRPIFSPLTGLYGMEQIPTNMIDRIEVVRGGGSALYGSSAIGGTVNVITRIPKENSYELNYTYQSINQQADDHLLNGNATILSKNKNAGVSFFVNRRNRAFYDHNDDQFSELPELQNNAFGANLFLLPSDNQKLEISLSSLNEYRFGGEMVEGPAHLAQQAEERTHNVLMGSVDYQINFNQDNSSVILYAAGQQTDRNHYTGILPDEPEEIAAHLAAPPYGTSLNTTYQGGLQVNHRLRNFLGGSNVITVGTEYLVDDVLDVIEAYNYEIDQLTKNLGTFLQSDWEVTPQLNLLAGVRADHHNLVDRVLFSPRVSLLYKLQTNTQFRLSWGTGFRAPQAFDTDLHIAFAGGGISRISLAEQLREERSNSFSGSINYDKATERWVAGFTLEGFYTQLQDAFYLHPLGEDEFGERFEKRNGDGSTVQGATLELRANYDQKVQLEGGFTLQSSLFDVPVENIEGLSSRREFLRTPNEYGYALLSFMPTTRFSASLNYVYTGPMELVHFAGAPEQEVDEYKTSPSFHEFSIKTAYTIPLPQVESGLEVFAGIRNFTNAYQNDFDSGKNRDSNYVYGPGLPRTFFVGVKWKSL